MKSTRHKVIPVILSTCTDTIMLEDRGKEVWRIYNFLIWTHFSG